MAAPIPDHVAALDHLGRAQRFHRRAQRAEADADYLALRAYKWKARWERAMASRNSQRKKAQRARARLRALELQRQSPLERIIALGRMFP